MGTTKEALVWCSTTKPTSWTSLRQTTSQKRQVPQNRTPNGHYCIVRPRPMVWPVSSLPTATGSCRPLSKTTKPSRSSGISDIKDTCLSPARRRAKLHCSAFCEVGGTKSWSSATSSMVLEEIWPGLPEKPFVDLKCGLNVWVAGGGRNDQIWNWADKYVLLLVGQRGLFCWNLFCLFCCQWCFAKTSDCDS